MGLVVISIKIEIFEVIYIDQIYIRGSHNDRLGVEVTSSVAMATVDVAVDVAVLAVIALSSVVGDKEW